MAQDSDTSAGEDPPGHAPTRTILTVDERVDHIVEIMKRLEWVRGKSAPRLAAEWGLALSTVEGHSAEAHRLLKADRDEVDRNITIIATRAMVQAENAGDFQGIKAMGTLLLDVSGARAPAKQELTGKDGGPLNGPVIYVPTESDD